MLQTLAKPPGWKSEDLSQELRGHAERLRLTWVSSHMKWENFREKFGAQNWWRFQANQYVDNMVQNAANLKRDLEWEQSVLIQDEAVVKINLFLASRVQELLQYDKDEGPLVVFPEEGTRTARQEKKKPGPKVKQTNLTTKGRKAKPGVKPGTVNQGAEPNKRQQLEALLSGQGPDLGHSWVAGHRSPANLCVNCCICGHYLEQIETKEVFSKKIRHPCQWREPSAPKMGERPTHKMINAGKMWVCCQCGSRQWIGRVTLMPSLAKPCRQVYTGSDQFILKCIKKFAPRKDGLFRVPDRNRTQGSGEPSLVGREGLEPQTGQFPGDGGDVGQLCSLDRDDGVGGVCCDGESAGVGVSLNQGTSNPQSPQNLKGGPLPRPPGCPSDTNSGLAQTALQERPQGTGVTVPAFTVARTPSGPPIAHPQIRVRPKATGKTKASEDNTKQTKLKF